MEVRTGMGDNRRGVTWLRRSGVTWPRMAGAAVAVSMAMVGLSPALASAAARPDARSVAVVVRAQPGEEPAVEQLVLHMGGKVDQRIGIINGFSATMSPTAEAELSTAPAVLSVTGNDALHLLTNTYSAYSDQYSAYNVENQAGTRYVWSGNGTGAGVDVALIDSGVTPVQGLNSPGQVINGPDLTEESQQPSTSSLDTFGHGTFMAGIIAGHDAGVSTTATASSSAYLGVAPDARIVSVKVADARGMTDVSQVIAGIDWVVQHAHDPGMNIRVLNLSFGTDSTQSYQIDPLAYAAEVAWRAGIVVVTSAGNSGNTSGQLTMPAADPLVIAVGAADLNGQSERQRGDRPAVLQRRRRCPQPRPIGARCARPGTSRPRLVHRPDLRGDRPDQHRFFRGSGTSEAAAFVSGSVAQMLQARPNLTPDQVKALLVATASDIPVATPKLQGNGIMNIWAANHGSVPTTLQSFPPSTGTGSLDASRGTRKLVLRGVTLTGEQDFMGQPFNSTAMAAAEAAGSTWSGGVWNGSTWSGSTWSGSTWSGSTWSGNDWTGSTWSGSTWSTGTWTGSTWSGSTWSGSTWSGSTWSGSTWSGSTWSGDAWGGKKATNNGNDVSK